MKTGINYTGYWCNLARAVEIASLGGHKIEIFANSEHYPNAKNDYLDIIRPYYGEDIFSIGGEIKVEIHAPTVSDVYESIEDVLSRVNSAKANNRPKYNDTTTILKVATERLGFSVSQIESVKKIAVTIAQLEKSESILPQHTAEAIQYNSINNEYYCHEGRCENILLGSRLQSAILSLNGLTETQQVRLLEYIDKIK